MPADRRSTAVWVITFGLSVLALPASSAGNFSSTLEARTVLQAGCIVSDNMQITCSPDVNSVSVTVAGSNNAAHGPPGNGEAAPRAMKLGVSAPSYEVYSDAAMTHAYATPDSAVGLALPAGGKPQWLPVYSRIGKSSGAIPTPGLYSGVLQVTVSW